MPLENIQEFRSDGTWSVSFCALLMPAYNVAKVAGPGGTFKRSGHFLYMMQDFRESSEAVGLSQVSKTLRQPKGRISAHNSSSKIRNTN